MIRPAVWVALTIGGAVALFAAGAMAAPITFAICDPANTQKPTFKVPPGTDKLEVRCPGSNVVVFTIAGCVGPKLKRIGTDYTLTCTSWNAYELVPKPR
jgi:hypothetical protein